jgi:hypothetical protein
MDRRVSLSGTERGNRVECWQGIPRCMLRSMLLDILTTCTSAEEVHRMLTGDSMAEEAQRSSAKRSCIIFCNSPMQHYFPRRILRSRRATFPFIPEHVLRYSVLGLHAPHVIGKSSRHVADNYSPKTIFDLKQRTN